MSFRPPPVATAPTAAAQSSPDALASPSRPSPLSPDSVLTSPLRPPQPVHKRTYQACIPCRQRKVRCDLGSVEAPHDPPCVRCRRESKECFFSATRRKRTPSGDIPIGLGRGRGLRRPEDDGTNGSFKRQRTAESADAEDEESADSGSFVSPGHGPTQRRFPHPIDPQLQSQPPLAPPPRPPHPAATSADTLLQTEVYNSHEALLTLIEAAGKDTPMSTNMMKSESQSQSDDGGDDSVQSGHVRTTSSGRTMHDSPQKTSSGRWNQSVRFSEVGGKASGPSGRMHPCHRKSSSAVSPGNQTLQPPSNDDGQSKALRAWNKFRFVKAGWFTAREAIAFMDYFYAQLHPLSPTLTNPTLLHASHARYHHLLLRHEPFLATVILTISSRYMTLGGPGGVSRSYQIHDMLWREVRNAFERIMWGGGWGGLGILKPIGVNAPVDPDNGATTGRGLRTLGTVEALLILTEWHVRGIHFPMDVEESDWGIEISDDEEEPVPKKASMGGIVVEGLGDRLENILEPAYRSDRMSWMLLGNALALAYELGVFDEIEGTATPAPTPPAFNALGHSSDPQMPFRIRSKRIQKLLLVYIMQLASRLGWTSMIPRSIRETVGQKGIQYAPPAGKAPDWSNPDLLQEVVYSTWVDLTMIMSQSSERLFPSRTITRQIMRSGSYVEMLEHFQKELSNWRQSFEALHLPAVVHHILVIEYEHVRFYVNSLALQAVVDRCRETQNPAIDTSTNSPQMSRSGPLTALGEIGPKDVEFIREVVDASRSLLSTVVHHMYPAGYLRHAPVRVYFRILSASMFLLKSFVLGAKEIEVKESMTLVEAVCECLRTASVDDLHLGLRFADILGGLAGRVKQRFIRMHRQGSADAEDTPGPFPELQQQQQQLPSEEENNMIYNEIPTTTPGAWWGNEDWLALPLDPILGFEGVTQGTMGVDVGGMDLLEVLLAPPAGGG